LELFGLSIELIVFLFLIALFAGLIDTLAGGGGLIVIPALIMSGVPPLAALGTNKLQGAMGTATATYIMFKKRKVNWQQSKYLMLSAFIGAVLGTVVIQFVNPDLLSFVIPLVLLCIGLYFFFSPSVDNNQRPATLSVASYRTRVIPFIGVYDGMFGPGTGSFFALAGIKFRGLGLIDSTAEAKPLNFSTNIASLIVFVMAGQVVWLIGIIMMLGQVLGALLGAKCLFVVNPKYIKLCVVLMCFSMLLKYILAQGWL
jgi:uncharacterized membrane protein YfcA